MCPSDSSMIPSDAALDQGTADDESSLTSLSDRDSPDREHSKVPRRGKKPSLSRNHETGNKRKKNASASRAPPTRKERSFLGKTVMNSKLLKEGRGVQIGSGDWPTKASDTLRGRMVGRVTTTLR